MDADNPRDVAANMVAIRGLQGAIERCDRYLSGQIRSENSYEFWLTVRGAVQAHAALSPTTGKGGL